MPLSRHTHTHCHSEPIDSPVNMRLTPSNEMTLLSTDTKNKVVHINFSKSPPLIQHAHHSNRLAAQKRHRYSGLLHNNKNILQDRRPSFRSRARAVLSTRALLQKHSLLRVEGRRRRERAYQRIVIFSQCAWQKAVPARCEAQPVGPLSPGRARRRSTIRRTRGRPQAGPCHGPVKHFSSS